MDELNTCIQISICDTCSYTTETHNNKGRPIIIVNIIKKVTHYYSKHNNKGHPIIIVNTIIKVTPLL